MMDLPKVVMRQFWQEMQQYEKEKHVPYLTSVERRDEKRETRGVTQRHTVTSCLKVRFGAQGLELLPSGPVGGGRGPVEAILTAVETATDLDEIRPLCA